MEAIQRLGQRLATIDVYRMLDEMFSTGKYQKLVPDMVRERLWEQGIYSTGKQIKTYNATQGNVYSQFTFPFKEAKGQPTDRVTLRDTGAFYRSFNLMPKQTYAVIQYDEKKPDGLVSDNVNLDNVFNLSEGEMETLRTEVLPDLVKMIKVKLSA